MKFNTYQLATIEKLIDDRIYFLKENIFYCQNDIDNYSIKESEKEANRKAIAEAIKEKNNLLTLKNNILYVMEQKKWKKNINYTNYNLLILIIK